MIKAIGSLCVGICLALNAGNARAETPPPGAGSGAGSAASTGTGSGAGSGAGTTVEKAGTDESLQNGGDSRPWASGVTRGEQTAALQMFHDGNVQLNDGLFAKAAEKYREALKHWDHPAIHYNLALALMNLDQPIEAFESFQVSVKYGEAPLQSRDKFDHAKDYMLLLDKQIAEVEVTCNKKGAKVSVDGKEVFVAPGTFKGKVRAGKHTFVAELEKHPTRIDAPYISPGAPFRIELKLYTVAELTRYHRKWQATWMPYAVIGGGVLAGVVGGLLELAATSNYKSYDDKIAACNTSSMNGGCAQSPELTDLKNSGDTKKTAGFVMYGIAGAAIVTGTALWWLNRPEAYQIRAEDLNENQITFAPVVAPGFAGGAVQGRF